MMVPSTGPLHLDVEAISGICGSISIACWVVVFSPQILENFRRNSADGLSVQFIIVWLLGDVFNILGAVLQGVLPTMIILAIYYTIADFVLLAQCFYYRGITWRDEVIPPPTPKAQTKNGNGIENGAGNGSARQPNERTALIDAANYHHFPDYSRERRGSTFSTDLSHLSPAVPLVSEPSPSEAVRPPQTWPQAIALNTVAILMVCAAGVAGWWLSQRCGHDGNDSGPQQPDNGEALSFSIWGQVFGYLCAALYLGSRLPQLLLNWRRKSTEGVSMLFFLFACLGNLTYVLSILAFDPDCHQGPSGTCAPGEASRIYGQYVLVNLSWLAGSAGTLLLDLGIFVQFFMYNMAGDGEFYDDDSIKADDERSIDGDGGQRWDQRPLLNRTSSDY